MTKQEELAITFLEMFKSWLSKNEHGLKNYPFTYFQEMQQIVNAQYLLIQKS